MIATHLPSPAASGITLWLVDLSLPPSDPGDPDQTALLSDAEKSKASRFHFERDARRYRASHTALRQLLAQVTRQPARTLNFVEGSFGKPRLWGGELPYFNMSHSGDWALIGFCDDAPIGVDIEIPRDMSDLEALAQRNFSQAEFQALLEIDPDHRQEAFLRCWTRKEACLKALGSGLSIEPAVFEAGIDTAPRFTSIDVQGEACGMMVHSLKLPFPGLAACARLSETDRCLAM